MQTAYITHPLCLEHEVGDQYPECPARIAAIEKQLIADGLMDSLSRYEAPPATNEQLLRVHEEGYIDSIEFAISRHGFVQIDSDTALNPFTYQAALHAAGAVVLGVDLVITGKINNAFCNIRPSSAKGVTLQLQTDSPLPLRMQTQEKGCSILLLQRIFEHSMAGDSTMFL